eukprot:XP_001709911.1 Hypothetical protein GL50803_37872 [Giardia lamblia ATCC 50803]
MNPGMVDGGKLCNEVCRPQLLQPQTLLLHPVRQPEEQPAILPPLMAVGRPGGANVVPDLAARRIC